MDKNKKILDICNCNMEDSMFSMHTCPCISIYIRFKHNGQDVNFWVEVPFNSELFRNDPRVAGEFIEKLGIITKKKLLNYTTDKQKITKNITDSTAKFNHKKS